MPEGLIDITKQLTDGIATEFDPDAPFPREYQLDITERCNHSCSFCANAKLVKWKEIDDALARRVLTEAYGLGSRLVGLYGTGEPFMNRHLADYVTLAKGLGYEYVYLDTNGALATPEKAGKVIDAGLDSVKFSINAGTRESYRTVHGHDDFDAVLAHLEWMANHRARTGSGLRIYVSMVVTDLVKDEVDILGARVAPFVDKWMPRKLFNCCGNNPENNDLGTIEALDIRGRSRSERCFQPFKGFAVTPDGYMSACVLDYQRALIFADLARTSLKDAWEGSVARTFRERHSVADTVGTICYNCIHNANEPFKPLTAEFAAMFRPDA